MTKKHVCEYQGGKSDVQPDKPARLAKVFVSQVFVSDPADPDEAGAHRNRHDLNGS